MLAKAWENFNKNSPKKTYRWLTNTLKDAQHHSLSEKCESKPQWGTISRQSEWLQSKSLQVNAFSFMAEYFLVTQKVKNLPTMQETQVWSLGQEDPLAIHSSILAWRILWTEEPGGLQSMGLQRFGHTEWITLSQYSIVYMYHNSLHLSMDI